VEAAGIEPAEDSLRVRLTGPNGTDKPLGSAALSKEVGLFRVPRSASFVGGEGPIDELHPRGTRSD
jgi:hypothetical protein